MRAAGGFPGANFFVLSNFFFFVSIWSKVTPASVGWEEGRESEVSFVCMFDQAAGS